MRVKTMLIAATAAVGVLMAPSVALASETHYIVVEGDTLSEIGTELNIPWQKLAELNNIEAPYIIFPEDELILSAKESAAPGPAVRVKVKVKVKPKFTDLSKARIKSIVREYGLDLKLNSASSIKAAAELGPMFGFSYIGGFATSGHVTRSDHYTGHALDLGTNSIKHGKRTGDATVEYVLKHRERLNIKYIIWDRQIWTPDRGWHAYVGASDHTDHVHLSFAS